MTQWLEKRKKDVFYRKAKAEDYRARSAYKLLELQEKFHIIKKGDTVVDLGAAPGSWSQVALEFAGKNGKVVAVDILPMAPISENFVFIQGDLTKETTIEKIKDEIGEADVVISDAAPEFSGVKVLDMGQAVDLNFAVLDLAKHVLKESGRFVCKSFQSSEFQNFLREVRKVFSDVKTAKPAASDKKSPELYVVASKKKLNH